MAIANLVIACLYLAFSEAIILIDRRIAIILTITPKNPIQSVITLPYTLYITFASAVALPEDLNNEPSAGFIKLTSKNDILLNIILSAHGNSFVPVSNANASAIIFYNQEASQYTKVASNSARPALTALSSSAVSVTSVESP